MHEAADGAISVLLFEVRLALIDVLLGFGDHGVDQSRQFVGAGSDGLGLVHASTQTPVIGTEGGLAAAQSDCGQLECLSDPIGAAFGFAADAAAAGDLGARAGAEP